jgi:hypothetical protein
VFTVYPGKYNLVSKFSMTHDAEETSLRLWDRFSTCTQLDHLPSCSDSLTSRR